MDKVNIRPGVSILSVLKHLNYKPWFALAEFVDNAIDSYSKYRKELIKMDGKKYRLEVEIEIDSTNNSIIIKDNAAGIHLEDFARAFRPAELPPDTSGLSEFGMGMKSAACWFTNYWTVRTKALGEKIERSVTFDIKKIVEDKIEELTISSDNSKPGNHYTVIRLTNLHNQPVRKTISKIKEHLSSIYRDFIRKRELFLFINSELLEYKEPEILTAPYYKSIESDDKNDGENENVFWKKKIEFDFGNDLNAKGFAAIRETGATSEAGFALFRRGRVIEGSADEGFRPEYIFGKPNSFAYQRLFGELHLEGFEISHTKDGFKWDNNMETFLELLKEELDKDPIPLLKQTEGYRKRPKADDLKKIAENSVDKTTETLEREIPGVLANLREKSEELSVEEELTKTLESTYREIKIELNDSQWVIQIELSYDPSIKDWIEVGDHLLKSVSKNKDVRRIGIRLSLTHAFMVRYAGTDGSIIEPILRIAAALGLSEVVARESGSKSQTEIRRNLNEILQNALSKP